MRTPKNYSTFLAADAVHPVKRRRHNPKRSKARFLPEQRKTLFLAWERGFLRDHKNYRLLSEITNLTRKQISNWARTQINKCEEGDLPRKNIAPLRTIFKELSHCMITDSETTPPCYFKNKAQEYKYIPPSLNFESRNYKPQHIKFEAQHQKPLRLNREPEHFKEEVLSSFDSPPQPHQYVFPYSTSRCINKIAEGNLPPMSLKLFPPHSGELAPSSKFSPDVKKTSTSTVVPRPGFRESLLTSFTSTIRESDHNLRQASENNMSSINRWVLQNALKGINKVDDNKVEILSILANTNYHDIIFYLMQNGWQPIAAKTGIHYVRTKPVWR